MAKDKACSRGPDRGWVLQGECGDGWAMRRTVAASVCVVDKVGLHTSESRRNGVLVHDSHRRQESTSLPPSCLKACSRLSTTNLNKFRLRMRFFIGTFWSISDICTLSGPILTAKREQRRTAGFCWKERGWFGSK